MAGHPKAVAFGVDPETLATLREAFPGWEIEAVGGGVPDPLVRCGCGGAADLLVVGAHDRAAETLGLCRGLRRQGAAPAPLLVLVRPGQDALVGPALDAGADSCLFLPVRAEDLLGVVARARAGDRPGRHTLNLDRPQPADPWRDDGGEG